LLCPRSDNEEDDLVVVLTSSVYVFKVFVENFVIDNGIFGYAIYVI